MLTWFNVWPLLATPLLLLGVPALIPYQFGGMVREYYLNHFALPALSVENAARLVEWFSAASYPQEVMLALGIVVNVNAILLPVLYLICISLITLSSWFARKEIDLKRQAVK